MTRPLALIAILLLATFPAAIAVGTRGETPASGDEMKRYGVRRGVINARSHGINGLQEGTESTDFDTLECDGWKQTHLRLAGADMLIEVTEPRFSVEIPEDRLSLLADVTIRTQ